jgi:tripeptide aminopeptidase
MWNNAARLSTEELHKMSQSSLSHTLLDRFLRYVAIDTMSDPHIIDQRPTSSGQLELLHVIEQQLHDLDITDTTFDPNGYLIARIPSNLPAGVTVPTIGFMAHVDVADDVMGNQVKPRVINSYDGNDIILNDTFHIAVDDNPDLKAYVGETLVVTDGTTLLGGDDKAGVAILVTLAEQLMHVDAVKHGTVELVFTSDEETGRGMDAFDVNLLTARCCYTVDGGRRGEIEAECFNAATVEVTFSGIPYHLGAARGRMVNSVSMATTFIAALPASESPEATDGRYGYYCAEEIEGTSAETHLTVYVRDFDYEGLQRRITVLTSLGTTIENLFPGGKVAISSTVMYRNMYEAIKKDPIIMEAVWNAGEQLGLSLEQNIIRGGTDGARLAEMGIPAPNLYTGSHNLHSRFEWVALPAMEESTRLAEAICAYWAGVTD